MKEIKTILLGIAMILFGIVFNQGLSLGLLIGIIGICVVVMGYFGDRKDE